jgi:hypothetical protein
VRRSFRLLAVAVLAVVLALSSTQNAFASVELAYDDGVAAHSLTTDYAGVLFSLPNGVVSAHLLSVKFAWTAIFNVNVVDIDITGPDHVTLLAPEIVVPNAGGMTGCLPGWNSGNPAYINYCTVMDISGQGIVVTGDFYVVLRRTGGASPAIDAANSGRSLFCPPFPGPCSLAEMTGSPSGDWLIRVDIAPTYAPQGPVGGFMEPVNKLVVFAPYLALFGVIGAVAVVFWKRPDN